MLDQLEGDGKSVNEYINRHKENKIIGIKQLKKLHLVAVVILMALYSSPGLATLTCTPKTTQVTINMNNIIINKDVPIGAKLTLVTAGNNTGSGYDCTTVNASVAVGIKSYLPSTGKYSGSSLIYTSNLAGIGILIGATGNLDYWIDSGLYNWGKGENYAMVSGITLGNNTVNYLLAPKVQLIKTGKISAGTLLGKIGAFIAGDMLVANKDWKTEIPINITGTVTILACSLNSTSISVPLGDIAANTFTGVGSTAGAKSFDVGLSCDKNANINVSLAGTQNTDSQETSVLALTSAGQTGTATGVGVQLLYGSVPLKINNNILLKTSTDGGKETLPFTARYYQTKAAIGAGLANSSATLNITYQ